ncbi:MAG: metallophosphoesterase [Lachnospiraceae bacterium]|nr:metallophosphoesterase [Lachnospiraceae bacterium]MDY5742168.1 metallophosphoesterase [Lachnospiraceae bacterium]
MSKKYLVISDTHGRHRNLERVLAKVGKIDAVFHLGDVEDGREYIQGLLSCPLYLVAGNNDFYSEAPVRLVVAMEGHTFLLTHGHLEQVYYGIDRLCYAGQEANADVVMFGHTHYPAVLRENGLLLLNPGSLSRPRQPGRKPTFAILEIDRFGEIHVTINELEDN